MVLACTAEAAGERNHKYNRQFSDFRSRLEAIADLKDLGNVRTSLLRSALELKTCVDKMAQDSQESVSHLQSELSKYQTRLEESERLASVDPLTGLDNRRKVEAELEARTRNASPFCIMMFDVNGFKPINDQLGHLAGDQILEAVRDRATVWRFARPISSGAGAGDEFLAILDCDLDQAKGQIMRIRQWVFGEYSIPTSAGER